MSLNSSEKGYDKKHRECLVVIWEVLTLRTYVYGRLFIIRTDHDTLIWILNMADATRKLARWCIRLQELYFYVVHRSCMKNRAADVLF